MIRAIGIDAAMANMGLARVEIHPGHTLGRIWCKQLQLVSTEPQHKKEVRKSSDNLRRCKELHRALHAFLGNAQVIFAEVPSGAQSAAAAAAFGMVTMLLASSPIPIIEVNPQEVKDAVRGKVGRAPLPKEQVIAWAEKNWPEAPWIRHERAGRVIGKNKKLISQWKAGDLQNCNEHLADAMAVIAAGIETPAFQQLMALQHATTRTPDSRPASRRISLD